MVEPSDYIEGLQKWTYPDYHINSNAAAVKHLNDNANLGSSLFWVLPNTVITFLGYLLHVGVSIHIAYYTKDAHLVVVLDGVVVGGRGVGRAPPRQRRGHVVQETRPPTSTSSSQL